MNLHRISSATGHRSGFKLTGIAVVLLSLLLAGCSSEAPKPAAKPEPKGPELLTGRSAFQKSFITARGWAPDAHPFRLESLPTNEGNGQDGKAALWRSSFASPLQHGVRPYFWSGSATPDAPPRGVSPGNEDSYSPSNATTQVFDMQFLKIDSDQAFAVAQKHGGEKVTSKDSSATVIYICDFDHNTNQLVWHVIYGPKRETAKLTVAVDASTGEFIRVEK